MEKGPGVRRRSGQGNGKDPGCPEVMGWDDMDRKAAGPAVKAPAFSISTAWRGPAPQALRPQMEGRHFRPHFHPEPNFRDRYPGEPRHRNIAHRQRPRRQASLHPAIVHILGKPAFRPGPGIDRAPRLSPRRPPDANHQGDDPGDHGRNGRRIFGASHQGRKPAILTGWRFSGGASTLSEACQTTRCRTPPWTTTDELLRSLPAARPRRPGLTMRLPVDTASSLARPPQPHPRTASPNSRPPDYAALAKDFNPSLAKPHR